MAGIANTGVAAIIDRAAAALRIVSLVMVASSKISIDRETSELLEPPRVQIRPIAEDARLSCRALQGSRSAGSSS
jgi:hypothetical protein